MTDILIKIVAVLALLSLLAFGEQLIERRGYDRRALEDAAAIAQQKAEASSTLASETNKTRTAERALQDFKNTQELQDATHQKTVADLSSRLRTLAGASGRLRDPQAPGCGAGSGGTASEAATASGDRPADGAQAGGLLSADLSGLLQRLQLEADVVNNAYTSCRADAFAVRKSP